MMTSMQGKFVWYELLTSDAAAAEAFYRSVIGWTARDSGHPDMAYTILSAGETMVAGLMALPEQARSAGARPGWNGYVAVDDVDAASGQFVADGGRVHMPPADIPGIGRFAVVSDPQGAVITLFRPNDGGNQPPAAPGVPGHAG